ncbi:MAG: AAA family ATPase [Actinobacteria bacterium]|nr:AAA family ATPase [Actinomycetota bacterium]
MALCPNCGNDNSDKAKFCSECATPLSAAPTPQAEERKVVSVLFVDLVGFTARSHGADPEDVRAALTPYHRLLKSEIERFGGTVEKFIGDAVMAVFGAPFAHEDDAERAVRAALRITEAIEELNEATADVDLSIRAAVNTGEGLVALGARPGAGEAMVTGDVVNTASRLQGIAPVGGVAVGEITYRSTRDFISYEPLDPVTLKGKPEPIPVWRAVSARSRFGVDVDITPKTPFIGRAIDLTILKTTYQRTLRESSLQLVTVVGEPGVGKTRLLAEFSSFIDDQDDLVYWRQGRSLPYGEGITFWALGEIVKAQAGILESDSPETAADKLGVAVEAVVEDTAERTWFGARLASLVGAKTQQVGGGADKEESYTAWRRFLEAIASRNPLVLVFEDLHWADAAMLGFIDHLVEWSTGVALLVVCTARPELYESHPGWGGGKRNSTTIALSCLSDSETAQLISALLSQAVLPAEVHSALLERAGGNPLYAEEFIRMLSDRGVLHKKGRILTIDPKADIVMPDNVHALIAARLDTLSSERKALLHDASVVGKVFWSGAVTALGDRDDRAVRDGLHELARKELVRPARSSSMEGQQEYSFWHALVRDVAYGQIPRTARAGKHEAVAKWLQESAGDRVADHAEVLVHHYSEALDLTTASGRHHDVERLEAFSCRFLVMAGDRALDLDIPRAHSYFQRALRYMPPGHDDRGKVLIQAGQAARMLNRYEEALPALGEALDEFQRHGNMIGVGEAKLKLAAVAWTRGATKQFATQLSEALEVLEQQPPGPELAGAYANAADKHAFAGRFEDALEWSHKALALAEQLKADREIAWSLASRGGARCELGDMGGLADLRESLDMTLRQGKSSDAMATYSYLGCQTYFDEGPRPALEVHEAGIKYGLSRGAFEDTTWLKAEATWMRFDLGEWDRLLADAGEVVAQAKLSGAAQMTAIVLPCKAHVIALRSKSSEAAALEPRYMVLARDIGDLQVLVPALRVAAVVRAGIGDSAGVCELGREFAQSTEDSPGWRARHLPDIIRALVASRQLESAIELLVAERDVFSARDRHSALTAKAIVTEAKGEIEEACELYHRATQRWADYGYVLEEAQAHLGLARCLIALGDGSAAMDPLNRARALFESLGAVPLLSEVDDYLGEMQAAGG